MVVVKILVVAVVVVVIVLVWVAEEVMVLVLVTVLVVVADGTRVEVEVTVEVVVAVDLDLGSVTVRVGAELVKYTVTTVSSNFVHSTCCGYELTALSSSEPATTLPVSDTEERRCAAGTCRTFAKRLRLFFPFAATTAFCWPLDSFMPV